METNSERKKNSTGAKMPSVPVAKIFPGYKKDIVATDAQLKQIAADFSLERVELFKCSFEFQAFQRKKIIAKGRLIAHFPQYCVSSGVLIHQVLESDFEIAFQSKDLSLGENFSMTQEDSEEQDIFYYEGDILPLGEAALEQFALEIPPYPRAENCEYLIASSKNESESPEEKVSPFDVLKKIPFKSK